MVVVKVCCLNLGRVFYVTLVVSVGGEVILVSEVVWSSLGVNLGF